ncbi:MAG: hypothetical protein OES32_05180 [Acidobacteriota bacterium]|nr:hypothetical protein [Acidobacteriota bacterium]MDH3522961.1 hypothetical protein [Acidobacteriota bacterium]
MPEGVIVGGWSYVIAAYSITAIVLVAYAWSIHRRGRDERGKRGRHE